MKNKKKYLVIAERDIKKFLNIEYDKKKINLNYCDFKCTAENYWQITKKIKSLRPDALVYIVNNSNDINKNNALKLFFQNVTFTRMMCAISNIHGIKLVQIMIQSNELSDYEKVKRYFGDFAKTLVVSYSNANIVHEIQVGSKIDLSITTE